MENEVLRLRNPGGKLDGLVKANTINSAKDFPEGVNPHIGCGDPIINDDQMAGVGIGYVAMGKGWADAAEKWATGFADDIENNIIQDHAPTEINYNQNYYGGLLHQKGFNYIHPTAIIDEGVTMGTGNYIEAYAHIYNGVTLGDNNYIGSFCLIGAPAEHKAFWGKPGAGVVIGNNNKITGHVTVDAGTERATEIGNDNYLLKHCHAGHDSIIGDNVTISCGAKIGGHCEIASFNNIGHLPTAGQVREYTRGQWPWWKKWTNLLRGRGAR